MWRAGCRVCRRSPKSDMKCRLRLDQLPCVFPIITMRKAGSCAMKSRPSASCSAQPFFQPPHFNIVKIHCHNPG